MKNSILQLNRNQQSLTAWPCVVRLQAQLFLSVNYNLRTRETASNIIHKVGSRVLYVGITQYRLAQVLSALRLYNKLKPPVKWTYNKSLICLLFSMEALLLQQVSQTTLSCKELLPCSFNSPTWTMKFRSLRADSNLNCLEQDSSNNTFQVMALVTVTVLPTHPL